MDQTNIVQHNRTNRGNYKKSELKMENGALVGGFVWQWVIGQYTFPCWNRMRILDKVSFPKD